MSLAHHSASEQGMNRVATPVGLLHQCLPFQPWGSAKFPEIESEDLILHFSTLKLVRIFKKCYNSQW